MIQNKLKKAREDAGLNYRETADKAGLTTAGYWQIENGKRGASYSVMVKLAEVFGTTPDSIFLNK